MAKIIGRYEAALDSGLELRDYRPFLRSMRFEGLGNSTDPISLRRRHADEFASILAEKRAELRGEVKPRRKAATRKPRTAKK